VKVNIEEYMFKIYYFITWKFCSSIIYRPLTIIIDVITRNFCDVIAVPCYPKPSFACPRGADRY